MRLARVPTARLYDEEGKVSTTPFKMFHASTPLTICGRAISWWLVAPAGAGNNERSRGQLAYLKMQLSTRQLRHGRFVRVFY
jgi:hypothetical protein